MRRTWGLFRSPDPKEGAEIEPQIWDEKPCDHAKSVLGRLMCEAKGCQNVATKTYVIISGKECREGYTDVDVCEAHEYEVLNIFEGLV